MNLAPDLAALNDLGGFFVLRTGAPPHRPLPSLAQAYATPVTDPTTAPVTDPTTAPVTDPTTAPVTDPTTASTTDPATDPDGHPLAVRVRRVADGIGAPEARVAASVAHQALAARLWSAALGCAVLYGRLPDLDARLIRWDPAGSAPDDLWLTEVRARPADPDTVADAVLHGHLEPLAAALRARYRLAPGLLRGNAASALAAAARLLESRARDSGRTAAGHHARELAARLLAHPLLHGAGTGTGTGFRRRSCCLYYRVPGGGLCGDCCFTRVPGSSPRAASE
ncbi:(2Fe-2S)-binding protein [Streptomyces sp. NPDC001231]|uniref:(2Fe-2S)-binding protein n=1 Tax=Streptomyces sp. NPDC001231 TaxID=3364549 RepID=UPI0036A8675F